VSKCLHITAPVSSGKFSRYPVPELKTLPDDIQEMITDVTEKVYYINIQP